jgi:hypothetical protein
MLKLWLEHCRQVDRHPQENQCVTESGE